VTLLASFEQLVQLKTYALQSWQVPLTKIDPSAHEVQAGLSLPSFEQVRQAGLVLVQLLHASELLVKKNPDAQLEQVLSVWLHAIQLL